MGIIIKQVEVTVEGAVVKKFDGKTSSLRFSLEQALSLKNDIDDVIKLMLTDQGTPAGGSL